MSNAWRHEPFCWAPERKLGGGCICFKGAPSPPPAPNYAAAAVAQQKAGMSSQYTPYGNSVYSADPTSPSKFRSDITLSPEAQQTLDTQLRLSNQMGGLTSNQVGNVNQQPMDLQSIQDVSDRSYAQQTGRLNPQWNQRQQQQETALRNQGLVAGGEAYDNSMRDFNTGRNDAYTQARVQADATMPQTYQLASSQYNQPLNYLNALRTGAQIQNPQFQQQPGANMLGAAQSQSQYAQGLYNSGVGSANSFNSGLMSLAGTGAGLLFMSDRRLKSKIKRIGDHPLGIGIYEYEIFGKPDVGVMADEVLTVKPEAVIQHPSGFLMVDYGRL